MGEFNLEGNFGSVPKLGEFRLINTHHNFLSLAL